MKQSHVEILEETQRIHIEDAVNNRCKELADQGAEVISIAFSVVPGMEFEPSPHGAMKVEVNTFFAFIHYSFEV